MDYNGFIRLIQFFDNALFKMLGDFVPERTSLSTGVTIESPVLERNKAAYSIPNIINQEVYDAEYPAPVISEQYDNLYNNLGGDKAAYFTGEISGSEFDIHHIFEEANFNPYLGNWDIYNAQHSVSKSIDINKFIHSDYDVLFNNVSENVTSRYRKYIEYIWGTTGSILVPTQLQDSYLTLRSYNISRYEGSKLTSLKYNNYTSTNYTGSDGLSIQTGDISYGKTAAINIAPEYGSKGGSIIFNSSEAGSFTDLAKVSPPLSKLSPYPRWRGFCSVPIVIHLRCADFGEDRRRH